MCESTKLFLHRGKKSRDTGMDKRPFLSEEEKGAGKMKSIYDCYTLSNGYKIPCMGYGTYKAAEKRMQRS